MQIEDNLTLLTNILAKGDAIIFPSDGIWGIGCSAKNVDAVNSIISRIKDDTYSEIEIIVADLPMLKRNVTDLHPRVETLLVYHQRPIRIKCGQTLIENRSPYFRIVKDQVSRILLAEIGYPIFFVSFYNSSLNEHLSINEIRVQDYDRISFIAETGSNFQLERTPLLKVEFDYEGLIKVLS